MALRTSTGFQRSRMARRSFPTLPLLLALVVLVLTVRGAQGGEVRKERFAKGAKTAAQSYAATGAARIGLFVVAADQAPSPGYRYAGRFVLSARRQLESDPHGMPGHHELRLYEVIRAAFEAAGYEVYSLNRKPWKGLQLKEVVARSDPDDLVCVVHYAIRRTRRILEDDDHAWWVPFEGMALSTKLAVYDAESGERVHGLEVNTLGSKALFEALGPQVREEPMYASGYDRHGSPNAYKIAIYATSLHDLRKSQYPVPVIRTAKGFLGIVTGAGNWMYDYAVDKEAMRRMNIPVPEDVAEKNSVLARLLQYVEFRPRDDDVEFYDTESIERCGQLVRGRIPSRPGR